MRQAPSLLSPDSIVEFSVDPISMHQAASLLLAAAVTQLYPNAQLVEGQGTEQCFFYDFVFPFEFKEEFLPLIEERMRLILKQKEEIRIFEMMPQVAAGMLEHNGQLLAAEQLFLAKSATIWMCQIGQLTCPCPDPFVRWEEISFFKLLEALPVPLSPLAKVRLIGRSASDKKDLKNLSKTRISDRCHLTLAQELQLFAHNESGSWIWLPKGERLRQNLIAWWKALHQKQNFEFVATSASVSATSEYFLHTHLSRVAEIKIFSAAEEVNPELGLLDSQDSFVDRAYISCVEDKLLEECISSLQFILDIPKILGFEFEIVLCISNDGSKKMREEAAHLLQQALKKINLDVRTEKSQNRGMFAQIEVRIADALGRKWTGPFLQIPQVSSPEVKRRVLIRSCFGSMERLVALLLERNAGYLPLFLAPEQVRILIVQPQWKNYGQQTKEELEAVGIRANIESDEEKNALKTRLYHAIKQRVPYILLLGEREEKAQTVTVWAYGKSEEQNVSVDEFCTKLKSETRSHTSELTN